MSQPEHRLATEAVPSYDYERILDLIQRMRDCIDLMDKYLSERTPGGSGRVRGYAAQVVADAMELRELLAQRHRDIQEGQS